jgi:ATP-dependent helicase/nuclease subunit B
MSIAGFPLAAPFLTALAAAWLDQAAHAGRDPADGLILLPSRRAARAAAAGFLEVAGGKPLLLPRILALGAVDEAALSLAGALGLPPAIPAAERIAMLAALILARNGADGAPTRVPDTLRLAGDLASLIDEADRAEIDLASALPEVVAPELAAHWQKTLDFLQIVTHAWPEILAERGMLDPTARQRRLLDAQTSAWQAAPPAAPVWLAGLAAASPALSRMARVVAGLPQGAVILAGFDPDLTEASWAALDDLPTHPQAGIKHLLTAMGARREEVVPWPAKGCTSSEARVALLRRAFLPAVALGTWQTPFTGTTAGLLRLDARDEQEEARSIALALREALELPNQSAALVTPDRKLATRVAAELARLGIRAEDSAGEALVATPPSVFLRLIAAALASELAPAPLLALLKHPFAAAGLPPAACRDLARRLEIATLRGPRPEPGFTGLRFAADQARDGDLPNFVARLQACLQPGLAAFAAIVVNPAALADAAIETAENLARTDEKTGAEILWSGESGGMLAELLADSLPTLVSLPDMAPGDLGDLLDAVIDDTRLRRPRSHDQHPRIAIWGILEARLQYVDTLVVGGLIEGVFPAESDPGPWLSRPMRRKIGLPPAEDRIGEAAHDLISLAAVCPKVILSASRRQNRAPAVASRFLARIDAMLAGSSMILAPHPAAAWARALDQPAARTERPRPAPRPPGTHRPLRYSISEIATLMADPYSIYAKRVLGLRELACLDKETDAALFGNIVHDGLAEFHAGAGPDAPEGLTRLSNALERAMRHHRPRPALAAWWSARLDRLAAWIIETEQTRRDNHGSPAKIALERPAEWQIGEFLLRGRADRIERRADGSIAIIDYKTGQPPNDAKVEAGTAPQLVLEALMAMEGAFGPEFQGPVAELAYWRLSGGATEGDIKPLFKGNTEHLHSVITKAGFALPDLLRLYALETTPYLDRPHPSRATYDRVYAGVSRRAEWDDGI